MGPDPPWKFLCRTLFRRPPLMDDTARCYSIAVVLRRRRAKRLVSRPGAPVAQPPGKLPRRGGGGAVGRLCYRPTRAAIFRCMMSLSQQLNKTDVGIAFHLICA